MPNGCLHNVGRAAHTLIRKLTIVHSIPCVLGRLWTLSICDIYWKFMVCSLV